MARTAIGIDAQSELDELYRAHAAEIYRYVYAVLGNRADAEDIVQTTFVNALRALERGDHPRKPANWLITIAHNLMRQRFRQQQARPSLVELDRDVPTPEADEDGPAIEDLVRALQRIPTSQREALVLRELEGRPYKEIAAIVGTSVAALQTLIFRARRSLAEELENLVTCDRAELALSQHTDGRLGRKERRRLVAHLQECPNCARVAALGMKRRRAFKGLALLPLPFSLTLFKGAPSASAAVGLPTIGSGATVGTVAGVGATGVAAKVAIGIAAVAVASGAGYEGVKAVQDPATPRRPAKAAPVVATAPAPADVQTTPVSIKAKATAGKPDQARGRSATAPGHTKTAPKLQDRSTTAPGHTKTTPAPPRATPKRGLKTAPAKPVPVKGRSATAPGQTKTVPKPQATTPAARLKAETVRGKSATAPGHAEPVIDAKANKPQ